MPIFRTLLALGLCASISLADPVKLRTLNDQTLQGELVRLTSKEIVLQVDGKPVATPVTQVVDLEVQPANTQVGAATYTDVELTDGSLLHCSQYTLKGKNIELKLTAGQDLSLPLSTVSYVLNDAQSAKVRDEWQDLLASRGNNDLLAIKDQDVVQPLKGTIGEVSANGERIAFQTTSGTKGHPSLSRVHGMSFLRQPDATPPPTLCKVVDTAGDVFVAAGFSGSDSAITVTTVSGAKATLTQALLARLDFSKGKLTYLSSLEPLKVVETSTVDRVDHYRRDRNLDNDPIRLGRETFARGLALHATTELTYDIGGQYKEFHCVLGVDSAVGGDSHVRVVIEGDGNKLLGAEVTRTKIVVDGDPREKSSPLPVTLSVQNVKQLRITVTPVGLLDLGDHVTLADAKVSK